MKIRMKILGIIVCLVFLVQVAVFSNGQQEASPQIESAAPGTGEYAIEIYTFRTSSSTYVMGVALAELINKYSSWLTATALASDSQNANANVLINQKPKTAIGYVVLPVLYNGYPPFKEANNDLEVFSAFLQPSNCYMTLNQDIKSLKDLNGKRVMLGPPGGYFRHEIPKAMFEYLGIEPKYSTGGFADSVDALINGQVDVIIGGGTAISPDLNKWSFDTYTKLLAQYDVNFLSIDPKGMEYGMEKYNFETKPGPVLIPAGNYHEDCQEELFIMTTTAGWVCNKEMPDEVITEILNIMFEHADEFGDYAQAGKWVNFKNIALVPNPQWVNEAAKQFFIKHGIWEY